MPTYCYSVRKEGQLVLAFERIFPMGEAPQAIPLDGVDRAHGKEAERDYSLERVGIPSTKGWPMKPCFASGVHPKQAQELRDGLRRSGVPTEVTKSGDPVYTSAVHRKKALAARGLHDNASFS